MISLLQLQYFLAMAEEGHLTRTAEKLFVSQSTLSSMISKLENELGVELFDRKNNRMILNKYGKEYREHISAALAEIEAGERRVKSLASAGENRLSVAVTNALIWHDVIWNFRSKYPDIHIQLHSDKMSQYRQMLNEEKLDFIIAGVEDFDTRDCESVLLSRRNLCLCVASDHPLAKRESITLKEIESEPYIELSPGLPYRNFCDSIYKKANVRMNTVIECNYDMRPKLVLGGYGVAITTGGRRTLKIFNGCETIPITDDIAVREVRLFWDKNCKFNHIMQNFYDYMVEVHRDMPDY